MTEANNLISCDECGMVLDKKPLFQKYRYEAKKFENYQDLDMTENDYLIKNKKILLSFWADIEQTETSYLKYCPICNDVRYFKEVKDEKE